ncbi:hypothetical protein BKA93DRAFT_170140 [Sparassis latifolia]
MVRLDRGLSRDLVRLLQSRILAQVLHPLGAKVDRFLLQSHHPCIHFLVRFISFPETHKINSRSTSSCNPFPILTSAPLFATSNRHVSTRSGPVLVIKHKITKPISLRFRLRFALSNRNLQNPNRYDTYLVYALARSHCYHFAFNSCTRTINRRTHLTTSFSGLAHSNRKPQNTPRLPYLACAIEQKTTKHTTASLFGLRCRTENYKTHHSFLIWLALSNRNLQNPHCYDLALSLIYKTTKRHNKKA